MVRIGTADDVATISACFASAFHDDPVWGPWAFEDETTRDGKLRELMGFWAGAHVRNPTVWMTAGCESVAAWIPPGEPDLTPTEEAQFGPLIARLFGDRATELHALFDKFDEHHPTEAHWYLSIWGTRSDKAGQGFGSNVIRHSLQVVDRSGAPAYLESSNPANIPVYEALGFEPRVEFGVRGSPLLTTMWRPAR